MPATYICIPERNHVSRVCSVSAVLYLQVVLHVMLFPCFVLYEVCVRCPMWLFSVVPRFRVARVFSSSSSSYYYYYCCYYLLTGVLLSIE
jgi:hypothetical protein